MVRVPVPIWPPRMKSEVGTVTVVVLKSWALASLPSSHTLKRILVASPSGSFAVNENVSEAYVVSWAWGYGPIVTTGGSFLKKKCSTAGEGSRWPSLSIARTSNRGSVAPVGAYTVNTESVAAVRTQSESAGALGFSIRSS